MDHPFQAEESLCFLNTIGEIPNRRCWVGGSTNSNRQYITYPNEYLFNDLGEVCCELDMPFNLKLN